MKRTSHLLLILLYALAPLREAGAADASRVEARATRPNIVLVMADDQGWGQVGYNGHPHLKTLNLDGMAGGAFA